MVKYGTPVPVPVTHALRQSRGGAEMFGPLLLSANHDEGRRMQLKTLAGFVLGRIGSSGRRNRMYGEVWADEYLQ
jgi:hypothetical protein